jgi:hypothetical protein
MAGETGEIRRGIAETREEIDRHLRELGGQVRGEMNITRQARENLPQLLSGAALLGLAAGMLFGRPGRSKEAREIERERARLAREWQRLGEERGRFERGPSLLEMVGRPAEPDVP